MPDISQIKVDGVIYDIKDTTARQNAGVMVDTEMSDTSEAAVQNKVIKAYVDESIAQAKLEEGGDNAEILAEIAALEKALDLKVDVKEGYDLISEADQKKLDAIVISDDGAVKVDISQLSQETGNTIIFNCGNSAV